MRTEQLTTDADDDPGHAAVLRDPRPVRLVTVAVTGGFGPRSDREFDRALVEAELVDLDHLTERIARLPDSVAAQVRDAAHAIAQRLR